MNEEQIFQLYNLLQSIITEDYYYEWNVKRKFQKCGAYYTNAPPPAAGGDGEREAQLTEPVKGKPPTAVQSTLDRIRQPCDDENK